jgi:hypothetical protein
MTTIHTISLPFNFHNSDHLWCMRFPHLRSLTLGFWPTDDLTDKCDFLDFILAHSNTIEVLDLEYDGCDDDDYMFDEFSWERLQTTSLPHLHSLRGHPSTLESFALARLNCLSTTLRRLAVGPGGAGDIFNAILSPEIGSGPAVGHLLALQEIELDLYDLDDTEWAAVVDIIQHCAKCCPSLEVWRGALPTGLKIDAASLGGLFGLFHSLRVIYLHENSILGPRTGGKSDVELEDKPQDEPEDDPGLKAGNTLEEAGETVDERATEDDTRDDSVVEAYVRQMALSCGALQNVSVWRSYPMKDWWTISRTLNPTVPVGEVVCNISRRIIEERDLEWWWTSQ